MPPAVFTEANDFIVRVWLDRKFYMSFTSFNIRSQEVKGNGGRINGTLGKQQTLYNRWRPFWLPALVLCVFLGSKGASDEGRQENNEEEGGGKKGMLESDKEDRKEKMSSQWNERRQRNEGGVHTGSTGSSCPLEGSKVGACPEKNERERESVHVISIIDQKSFFGARIRVLTCGRYTCVGGRVAQLVLAAASAALASAGNGRQRTGEDIHY